MKHSYKIMSVVIVYLILFGSHGGITSDTMEKELTDKINNAASSVIAENNLLDLGKLLYLRKRFDDAFQSFYRFVRNYDKSSKVSEAYYWMALCRYASGDFSESIKYTKYLMDVYITSPLLADIKTLNADSLYALGNFKEARLMYHDIIVYHSESALLSHVYMKFAECDERLGLSTEAKEFCDFIQKHFPDSYESKTLIKRNEGMDDKSNSSAKDDTKPEETIPKTKPIEYATYYTIQIIALSDIDKAKSLQMELSNKKIPVYILTSTINDKTLYRVRIGKYPDKETALLALETIANKTGYQGYVTVYTSN